MARHELWVELADQPGRLAAVAADLAACGANIVHLDVHPTPGTTVVDRLVVEVPDERSDEVNGAADRCGARRTPPPPAAPSSSPGSPVGVVTPFGRAPTVLERFVALAALVGEDIVGLGCYDVDASVPDAEVSVTVEDRQQRRGIGTLLVSELALLARTAHIRRLRVIAKPDDQLPAALLHRAALEPVARHDRGRLVLECSPSPSMSATA
jgi:GNAT superfamily N-acetyltransferase